jgi:DNA-binding FadR family transcriptional regulator
MNGGPTTTRVYDVLRRRIMERGYAPGARLDPQAVADELASSTTPVRDALHVLAGEELITLNPNGGFFCAVVDEPGLVDLYAWNDAVLNIVLRDRKQDPPVPATWVGTLSPELVAERARSLFQSMADASHNIEHGRVMRRINARLHGARQIETTLFPDAIEELESIAHCYSALDLPELRRRLGRYGRRRQIHAGEVVRQLYRAAPSREG